MTMFALAAALAAAAASPVVVAPVAPVAPAASENAPPAKPVSPQADNRRVCVTGMLTGSRLPHEECRTRAQWIAEGFDPLAKR